MCTVLQAKDFHLAYTSACYLLRKSSLDIKITLMFAAAITVLVIVGWLLGPWRMGTESLSL